MHSLRKGGGELRTIKMLETKDPWWVIPVESFQPDEPKASIAGNSMFTITPYKEQGIWRFDDHRVGLVGEPFVGDVNTMIDRMVNGLKKPEKGFNLTFSRHPFPGHGIELTFSKKEAGGTTYLCKEMNLRGWLCPALFHYFTRSPRKLFGGATPLD